MLEDLVTEWLWAGSTESEVLANQIADIVDYNNIKNNIKLKSKSRKNGMYIVRDYFKRLQFYLYYKGRIRCVADIMAQLGIINDVEIPSWCQWNCEISENGFMPPPRKVYNELTMAYNLESWEQYLPYNKLLDIINEKS